VTGRGSGSTRGGRKSWQNPKPVTLVIQVSKENDGGFLGLCFTPNPQPGRQKPGSQMGAESGEGRERSCESRGNRLLVFWALKGFGGGWTRSEEGIVYLRFRSGGKENAFDIRPVF